MRKTRCVWVDTVKLFACILVVLGHFFQSMVAADILPATPLYGWFNTTIYYFHVPLFFICSGYLYQRTTGVASFSQWGGMVCRKALALGVPYFVFSTVTWLLKSVFADSVNEKADGLLHTLFVAPSSPYWYLYALFFLFCITLTVKSNRGAICAILVSVMMKLLSFVWSPDVPIVKYLLENEIWFVLGMLLCYCRIPEKLDKTKCGYIVLLGCAFIAASVIVYMYPVWSSPIAFGMGLAGCFITVLAAIKLDGKCAGCRSLRWLSAYTFPIFLMHTIFAAGLRSLLFKVGIGNPVVHILLGLVISFAGPVLAAWILSKIKGMEFLLYPNKILRIGGRENGKKA